MTVRSLHGLHVSRRTTLAAAVGASLLVMLLALAVNREATAAAPRYEPPPWPYHELPAEWRWEPPGVEYQHMFRDRGDEKRRLDWIREERR